MANRWADGFDHYATAQLIQMYEQYESVSIQTTRPRNGTRSLYSSDVNGWCEKWLDNQGTLIAGLALYIDAAVYSGELIPLAFWDGASSQVDVRITALGKIRVTRNGIELAITDVIYPLQQWHFLNFKALIADAGSWEVRLDKTLILSGNGDTKNTANAWANRVRFHAATANQFRYVDDFYINDLAGALNTDFWIDPKMVAKMGNANGTNQAWTPNAGVDHYSRVNEIPPDGDTSHLSSAVVDAVETNHHEDIALTGQIRSVLAFPYWRKDDAGARQAAAACRSGGANYFGPTVDLGDSYSYGKWIRETDPATGAAWTVPGFNAAEWGGKVIS